MNKKYLIVGILAMLLVLTPLMSATTWTRSIDYSEEDIREVTFKNWWGLGAEQGRVNLRSHELDERGEIITKQVGLGWQATMYYDFDFNEDLNDVLGDVEFIDMKTGKPVEKEWKYVYAEETQWEIPIYKEICPETKERFTEDYEHEEWKNENCKWEFDYYEYHPRTIWHDYNSTDIPKGNIRIGIMVNVQDGEYIDGIWNIGSKKLDKHAPWLGGAMEYAYVGGGGNQSVIKYDEDFNIVAVSPNYGGTIHSITLDDDYIYYGGGTTRTVRKAYKSNLSTITDSPNYGGVIDSITLDDDYIYYGGFTTQTIKKVEKSNLNTVIDETPDYGGTIHALAVDDDYVYYGGQTTQTIKKVAKSDLSTIIDETSNYGGHLTTVAIHDDYIYYGGGITRTIKKVAKSDLSTAIDETPNYGGTILAVAVDDDYIYYGGWTTQTVRKAYKSNLSTITDSPNYGGAIHSITLDNSTIKLEINLISPANNTFTSDTEIDFTANVTDDESLNITNVSLIIDDVIVQTNSSGDEGVYTFTETLSDGEYEWRVIGYDGEDEIYYSDENRTLTIDSTPPTINIISPTVLMNYGYTGHNITLNFTASDTNIDTVWYDYNGVNKSLSEISGYYTDTISPVTVHNLTIYANDTMGNLAEEIITWDYKVWETSRSYDLNTYETSTSTYQIVVESDSLLTKVELQYGAYEIWNMVNKGSGVWEVEKTISELWNGNNDIVFKFTYNESVFLSDYVTQQTVSLIDFDFHSGGYTESLKIYVRDEDTNALILDTTLSIDSDYWIDDGSIVKRLFDNDLKDGEFTLGFTPTHLAELYTDTHIWVEAPGYQIRNYYDALTLTNDTQEEVTLYMLDLASGIITRYKLISPLTGVAIQGVELNAYKQMIPETLVEIAHTDATGIATMYQDPDYFYRMVFSKENCTTIESTIRPTTSEIQYIEMACDGDEVDVPVEYPWYTPQDKESFEMMIYPTTTILRPGVNTFRGEVTDSACKMTQTQMRVYVNDTLRNMTTQYNTCNEVITLTANITGSENILVRLNTTRRGQMEVHQKSYTLALPTPTETMPSLADVLVNNPMSANLTFDKLGITYRTRIFLALIGLFILITATSNREGFKSEGIATLLIVVGYVGILSIIGWLYMPITENIEFINKYGIGLLTMMLVGAVIAGIKTHT